MPLTDIAIRNAKAGATVAKLSDGGGLQLWVMPTGAKLWRMAYRFYAFDLLYLNGHDLRTMTQSERRDILADVLSAQPHGSIGMSEDIDADGAAFLKLACEMGLEGIIAKRRSAPYRSGRGGEWLKIKCVQSEGFAIIGFEPSRAALGGIGRLLLGAMKDGALVYVGGVGTGFTASSGTALRKQMGKLATDKPAATGTGRRREVVWIKPELVAEVAFRAWTDDGKLRHASFKGLREGEDAAEVYEL